MNGFCNRVYCVCCKYYDCDCYDKGYQVASYEELSKRKADPRFSDYKKQISEVMQIDEAIKSKIHKAISSNYPLSGLSYEGNLKDANDFLDSVSYLDDVEYDPNDPDIVSKYTRAANLSIAYLKAHGGLKSTESNGTNSIKRAIYIINSCIMGGNYELVTVEQKEDESKEPEKERFVPVCTDEEEGFYIADNSFTFTFDLSKSSKLYNSVSVMMDYYFKNLRWEYERFSRMILDTKSMTDSYWDSNSDDVAVNLWAPMIRSLSLDPNEYEIRFRYDQQTYQFQFNKDTYSIIIIFKRVNNLPISDIMDLVYGRTTVKDVIDKNNETDTEENIKDKENTGLVIINPYLNATKKYSYLTSDKDIKENEPEVYQYVVKLMKRYGETKNIYTDDLEKFILGMKQFIKDEPMYKINPKINYINFKVSYDDVIFQFFCPELNNFVTILINVFTNDTWRAIFKNKEN